MNTRIFLKTAWLFILGLLSYLFFVVFILSPKINDYLTNVEMNHSKVQFEKIVSAINEKSKNIENSEEFANEIQLLLSGVILGKSGSVYVFDGSGNIISDPNREFSSKEFDKILIPGIDKKYLFEELKKAYDDKKVFEYNWNIAYDPYNYTYQKLSWVGYNQKLDWYIVSNIYKDDFSGFIDGINSLILSISMVLFGILTIIAVIITVNIIAPISKMFKEVQKANVEPELENSVKSTDEIGFLANQFNTLLDQVENNRKNIEEQVQVKTKEIQDRLYYDDLTNLKNRTALEDDIKGSDFVSVALIDVDSFGDINELYGFSTGNLVLIQVAKILSEFATKFSVTPYRIYGNVFCLADRKMMGFAKYDEFISSLCIIFKNRPIRIEELDIDVFINITLGISIAQDEPIKAASIALKKAKQSNMKFFVYNNEIDTKEMIQKTMFWREKIKIAIEKKNVVPFYQPISDRNNEVVKYETLMRIKDVNEKGETIYLSPYLFLDISIKTKQYLQLSNQIISKALEDLKKTTKQVSINLSFQDILDSDFIASLDRNIDKLDSDNKQRVVFEILESDYISDYTVLEEFILKYRSQGIKIAIDDFGTGYSNFAHILKIRPNYIKIDGSLIKNINNDKNSYEMVKSIIDFSKALNIKVIAEFVHSKEVYESLLDLGVNEFQGFYLAEPSLNIE